MLKKKTPIGNITTKAGFDLIQPTLKLTIQW